MLIQADAFHLPYPDNYFHACVTSPPYWGLRRYEGDQGAEPLGLEPTPQEHIARMVAVFREVYRVLRDDGVCWLNYGDAFDGGELLMMPHRLAIALQDDGWIVRNDVVWWKRNPMPESVNGWRFENGTLRRGSWRHTRAHEYVFQLVKGMQYYCNQEAVREGWVDKRNGRAGGNDNVVKGRLGRSDYRPTGQPLSSGRNPRSVLDVPAAPYSGSHYATFPPNLIAPLIRASVPRRCCPDCGAPWAPVVERGSLEAYNERGKFGYSADKMDENQYDQGSNRARDGHMPGRYFPTNVTGYRPTCECGHSDHKPGIVLDIFGGTGTVGLVAKELLRRWVVMDISRPYLDEQAKVRTGTGTPSKALDGLPMFQDD